MREKILLNSQNFYPKKNSFELAGDDTDELMEEISELFKVTKIELI